MSESIQRKVAQEKYIGASESFIGDSTQHKDRSTLFDIPKRYLLAK